jgi:stringent starvation protein B
MSVSGGDAPSTRPYLIRALHEWCTDNGFSPHIAVRVDGSVRVPLEFVKNEEIIFNVSYEATNALQLGNEFIEFKARFGGVPRDIVVPVTHVLAIYARENGQGMAFPPPHGPALAEEAERPVGADPHAVPVDKPQVSDQAPGAESRNPLRSVPTEGTASAPVGELSPDGPGKGPSRPSLKRVK